VEAKKDSSNGQRLSANSAPASSDFMSQVPTGQSSTPFLIFWPCQSKSRCRGVPSAGRRQPSRPSSARTCGTWSAP
jgi:hypothetical protein